MPVPRGFRFVRRNWPFVTLVFLGFFIHWIVVGWTISGLIGAAGLLWVFVAMIGADPYDR